jgi:uroporphyrin-3 C-methyltransferase
VGVAPTASLRHTGTYLLGAVAIAALVSSGLLWQKLNTIQEQLARQSADAGAQAIEARAMARQAQELVRDTAARSRSQRPGWARWRCNAASSKN